MSATAAPPALPLQVALFRNLWLASLVSNLGTWVHESAATWHMTVISPDPSLVALVQAAAALPLFALALPAGALADLVDRRRLLLVSQGWMMLVALALAVSAWNGWLTPWVLLGLITALALGNALGMSSLQAIIPELVPKPLLPQAMTLSSATINGSRAVGPALGGALIAFQGPGAAFLFNALTFLGMIVFLWRWPRPREVQRMPAEHLLPAMISGVRFVFHARLIRRLLIRVLLLIIPTSLLWISMPLVAKAIDGGSLVFGFLLSATGAGAVVMTFFIGALRRRAESDGLLAFGAVVIGAALLGMSTLPPLPWLLAAACVGGMGWLVLIATINSTLQLVLPAWVRARGVSVYQVIFFGSMVLGAVGWGQLIAATSIGTALASAGGLTLLAVFVSRLQPLGALPVGTTDPAPAVPHPALDPAEAGASQILIEVVYTIDPAHRERFLALLADVREMRLRNGALLWYACKDPQQPQQVRELFMEGSWDDHLRHHGQVTAADDAIHARAWACCVPGVIPQVHHLPLIRP